MRAAQQVQRHGQTLAADAHALHLAEHGLAQRLNVGAALLQHEVDDARGQAQAGLLSLPLPLLALAVAFTLALAVIAVLAAVVALLFTL